MAKKYNRLFRNLPLLKILTKVSPSQRRLIIKRAKPDIIKCLCDICYNTTRGHLKLNKNQKKNAIRYKRLIRRLTDKSKNIEYKRKQILQRGGFLQVLIPAAISLASVLLPALLKNES